MNKGIAIAGNMIVDTVKMIDTFPEVGMLTNIRDIQPGCGGCAANTIADIALLDKTVPLKCIGLTGDDAQADWLFNLLGGLGIDMSMTKRTDRAATSFTDVMSAMDAGTRTFFHNRGANALFDITDIDLIALAERNEEIYTLNSSTPIVLEKRDYALKVLQRLRDEAHRFAITYHRSLRSKRALSSVLDEIKGLGKVKKLALIEKFKDIGGIISATSDELASTQGIGEKLAKIIIDYLTKEGLK